MNVHYETRRLPVAQIAIPTGRVQRNRHTPDRIDSMTQTMRRWGLLMPILVDRNWTLIDGERRLLNARSLGWAMIDARTVQVAADDLDPDALIELARIANVEQAAIDAVGEAEYARLKQKNHTELRMAIAEALIANPERSNRWHANRIGCSHPTVGTVRAELVAGGKIYHLEKATGADGKEHPTRRATVTRLPQHPDSKVASMALAKVVQRGVQLTTSLDGLVTAGEELAAIERAHRQDALARTNADARAAFREVLAISLEGLDQLRAVLAEDLAALDAAGEGVAA